MTISEPNPAIKPTGEEAGEFLDESLRSDDQVGGDDPTRRLTGSLPLESAPRADTATRGYEDSTADGFAMLKDGHREIERLFQGFGQEGEEVVPRDLCEHLTCNSEREEGALYPALRRHVDGGDELADRMESENSALATMIAELYDSATPERIPDLVAALRDAVGAHIEVVESEVFPALQANGVDAQQLASNLRTVKAQ